MNTEDIAAQQTQFRDNVGVETKALRLTQSTRKQYASRIEAFKKWLMANHPGCISERYLSEDGDGLEEVEEDIVLPLPDLILDQYMAHCLLKVDKSSGLYFDPPQYYSFSHVNGHRSAIQYLYSERKVEPSIDAKRIFKETLDGFKRKVADLKMRGEMPQMEGKQPMSQRGYHYLATIAMKQEEDYPLYIFCHTFLILCWNLIARAVTVGNIMFDHISWDEDALTINIGKQKNDQEGNNGFARHVYANPKNPTVCPVLAMALFVFCDSYRREGSDRRLFGSPSSTKDRFGKWLAKLLSCCSQELTALGIIIADIGSHSFRKGVATSLANDPGGPSAINIWLRAGWTLGPVQSRYIFEGAGGDQFVGRAATGISTSDMAFASLPPHFDETECEILSIAEWDDMLPGFLTFYPRSFRVALPYLLASIVYHEEWLSKFLPPSHPFFFTRLWTSNIISRLKPKVLTGFLQNEKSRLKATGIPPYVMLASRVTGVENRLDSNHNEVMTKLDIIAKQLPRDVTADVLEHCAVNGAVPLTARDVNGMLENLRRDIEGLTDAISNGINREASDPLASSTSIVTGSNEESNSYLMFCWGGRYRKVPEDFEFPKGSVKMLWDLWWGGMPLSRIRPFRHLEGIDLKTKKERNRLSKFARIMSMLLHTASVGNVYIDDIVEMRPSRRDELFSVLFVAVCKEALGVEDVEELDKRRINSMAYTTLYDFLNGTQRNKRKLSNLL